MKNILMLFAVLCCFNANAKIYYVSATGNDANTGLSSAAPWQTITKVNASFSSILAGDTIAFKCGDSFFGAINVTKSGASSKNIVFTSYGSGAKPVISGFTTISSLTNLGGGIYKKNIPSVKNNLILVTIDGIPQQIGRYPNVTDGNAGYLSYQSSSALTNIIDTVNSFPGWVGAGTVVTVRPNAWLVDENFVTGISGDTIKFRLGRNINAGNTPQLSPKKANHSYFFQNNVNTLDEYGEWFLDTAAKDLKIYFGAVNPASHVIKVATIDTLVRTAGFQYLTFNGLAFEGANMSGIFNVNGSNINILNCSFTNMGAKAIHLFSCANVVIDNVTTNYCLSNAIQVNNRTKNNVTVSNTITKNTAPYVGMDSYYDDADGIGIYVTVASQALIQNCIVDTVGKSGINFQGNYFTIINSTVNSYMWNYGDRGGIYTWVGGTDAAPAGYFTNRIVKGCIVLNGIGQPLGTPIAAPALAGIYMDGRTMNVDVLDNTIAWSAKNGIHSNNPYNVNLRNNLIFKCKRPISFMKWSWGSITNFNVKQNTIFSTAETDYTYFYTNAALGGTSLSANLAALGSIDSNYISNYNEAGFGTEVYATAGGALVKISPISFAAWKTISGQDAHTSIIKPISKYKINSTTGSNMVTNGDFASNVSGWTIFGSGTPSFTWLSGKARLSVATITPGNYTQVHRGVGGVDNAKKYVLRVTTTGSGNGIIRCKLRKQTTPFTDLTSSQLKSFGTAQQTHEFLFSNPTTMAAASVMLEIEQGSGTVDIDNIELYECNATQYNINDSVVFATNPTTAAVTIALTKKYITARNTIAQSSYNVPANSGFLGIYYGELLIQVQQNKFSVGRRVFKKQ